MNSSSIKQRLKDKINVIEKQYCKTDEETAVFKSIYKDIEEIKDNEDKPYKKWLQNLIRVVITIMLLKYLRKLLISSSQNNDQIQVFANNLTVDILYDLLFSISVLIFFFCVTFLLIDTFFISSSFKKSLKRPFTIMCISFLTIDILLILLFPDITIAIIQAYLNY